MVMMKLIIMRMVTMMMILITWMTKAITLWQQWFYTCPGIGVHKIHVLYHGEPIRGSPFLVKVADSSKVKFIPRPFKDGKGHVVHRDVDIPVHVPREAGEGTLEAEVVDPDLQTVPSTVTLESDGYHHIRLDTIDHLYLWAPPRGVGGGGRMWSMIPWSLKSCDFSPSFPISVNTGNL